MIDFLKYTAMIIIGFGSGVLISGAVFAFIAMIGIVPRMAQKTNSQKYVKLYEEAIIFGGIFGVFAGMFDFHLYVGKPLLMIMGLCCGIFFGVLAISLAEVLDMIPILTRRIRLQKGMFYFILSIAIGKLIGSISYFAVPGFFKP